jgi:hypothetical protein
MEEELIILQPEVVELPFNPEVVYAQALYDVIDEDLNFPYWD